MSANSVEDQFESAANWLSTSPSVANLSNDEKLEIYGVYKVVTNGPQPEGPAPSFFSLPATKAKHAAWISAGRKYGQDTDQARRRYIEIAQGLGWTFDGDSSAAGSSKRSAGIGGGSVSVMQKVETGGDDDRESMDAAPVVSAALTGDLSALQGIVGADSSLVNYQDDQGMTPLHFAADRGHTDVVRWLLEHGASRSIKDEDDMTAYDVAELSGRNEMLDMLRIPN